MVTGIETAGLVLATFPLVIEGLKYYLRGLETIKRWRHCVRFIEDLIRQINMERRKFKNNCTELLWDLVPAEELDSLLEDPGGFSWGNLHTSLHERLGQSFDDFLKAVNDMTDRLDEFKEKLELNDDGRPKWLTNNSSLKREWKRVQLSMTEESIQPLLDRLEKNNNNLLSLLQHSRRMEAMRASKSRKLDPARYGRIREHAQTLYDMLEHCLTKPCGCAVAHVASLQLEVRNEGSKSNAASRGYTLSFNVLFSFETDPATAKSLPWNWCDTIIEPLGLEDPDSDAAKQQIQMSRSTPPPTQSITATTTPPGVTAVGAFSSLTTMIGSVRLGGSDLRGIRSRSQTRVMFAVPPSYETPAASSPRTAESHLSAPDKIQCLCTTFRNYANQKSRLGVLTGETNPRRQHSINLTGAAICLDSARTVPLTALLSPMLGRKYRLSLAVKLASALLQLYQTPWLEETWGKQDILFVQQQDDSGNDILQKPFVSKPFVPPTCTVQKTQRGSPAIRPPRGVRNQSIFALGVLLIELWFGRPLEDLRIPTDMNEKNEANQITDFATARRLLEDVYRDAGDSYGNAVRRCLFCEFDQWPPSLDSRAMKEAVHRGVVMPLELYLKPFCDEKLDGLF